ncbi:MAG: DUF4199 domain-containing protein [Bacteroidetes bacterium]|nr:DUF4199 domain-containing protein [Bacteroidota bacterium]
MNALKAPGVKFGLISGLVYSIIITLIFSGGINSFQGWGRYMPLITTVTFALLAGFSERKLNGGYITFGRAVLVMGTVFIISELMFNITEVLLYNVVDPDLHNKVKAYMVEKTAETIDLFSGAISYKQDQIDEIMDAVRDADYRMNMYNAGSRFIVYSILDFVIAVILAIIVRREPKSSNSLDHDIT